MLLFLCHTCLLACIGLSATAWTKGGWRVELEMTREALRFEHLAARAEDQVTIEGDATLPGSMRDAVTVLSVQAQAHIMGVKAGAGEAVVRGRVQFQVLYTQGDLTKIRSLETSCSFEHGISMPGLSPQMRVKACAAVQETQGSAMSGRMTLRALVHIQADAFEMAEREWITDIVPPAAQKPACTVFKQMRTVAYCAAQMLGEGRALVREEFDLPAKLDAGEALSASATATVEEFSGGSGRIGVSGVVQVRVLHRPQTPGRALVTTQHELPYEAAVEAEMPENAQLRASAEVLDVMADAAQTAEGMMLRVEAEVRVMLEAQTQRETQLLEDVYSVGGPALLPEGETLDVHTSETVSDVRESVRLQMTLKNDAPPIGTALAAFAQPMIAMTSPAGRRLNVDGVMNLTLLYLPADSDIPCSVHAREPFSMAFPVEGDGDLRVQAYPIEAAPGACTSDRAEVRCVLGLHAVRHQTQRVHGICAIESGETEKPEHGFVIVWPAPEETQWETARRLRVAPDSLHPAGGRALLALRK